MEENKRRFNLPNFEPVEVKIDEKENITNRDWLNNNLSWNNISEIIFDEPVVLYWFNYDFEFKDRYKISFGTVDSALITSIHGFGGNSYLFHFKMNGKSVTIVYNTEFFGFSKEEVKNSVIEQEEYKIEQLESKIKLSTEIINNLKHGSR